LVGILIFTFLDTKREDKRFSTAEEYTEKRVVSIFGVEEITRGSHIFHKIGSQMAVRLSALSAGRPPFTRRKIPGTHFC
jgi:hypothetical protein